MSENLPTVAILLPVYSNDNPILFKNSLQSLITQSYPIDKIRIYVGIDGFIGIKIENILIEFSPHIYKVIRSKSNIGLSGILNLMISNLEDETYIARQDADDYSIDSRIYEQVNFLISNPQVAVLGSAIFVVNDKSLPPWPIRQFPETNVLCYKMLYIASPFAHPTVIFNKKILKNKLYYPNILLNEDIALWFNLAKDNFIFANLKLPLVYFTFNTETLKRRSRNKALSEFFIYINGIFKIYGLSWKLIFPFLRLIFRFLPLILIAKVYKMYQFRNRFLS